MQMIPISTHSSISGKGLQGACGRSLPTGARRGGRGGTWGAVVLRRRLPLLCRLTAGQRILG